MRFCIFLRLKFARIRRKAAQASRTRVPRASLLKKSGCILQPLFSLPVVLEQDHRHNAIYDSDDRRCGYESHSRDAAPRIKQSKLSHVLHLFRFASKVANWASSSFGSLSPNFA